MGPAVALGRDDRAPQGVAIGHRRIQTSSTIRDLGQHPALQLPADIGHIQLLEQRAEGEILRRLPELKPQCRVQRSVMVDGKAFQISQALAAAQDPERRHREKEPLGAHPAAHPSLGDRLQETDRVGRSIDSRRFWTRRDPFPPARANGRSPGERSCEGPSTSPAPTPVPSRGSVRGRAAGGKEVRTTRPEQG